MPKYVYGCTHKDHPRDEVEHSMDYVYLGRCEVCGEYQHKIPQPFQYGFSPVEILRDWSERNWSKKLRGEPRDYDNVSTQRGLPQKDYGARK
jgi:hypothetical protein